MIQALMGKGIQKARSPTPEYRPSGGVHIIRMHDPSWHAMCFTIGIQMTLFVSDAPGSALKIYSLSLHGCRYRQPFSIQRSQIWEKMVGNTTEQCRLAGGRAWSDVTARDDGQPDAWRRLPGASAQAAISRLSASTARCWSALIAPSVRSSRAAVVRMSSSPQNRSLSTLR